MESRGKRPKGSIILMNGLPGCGKSYLTNEIKSNLYKYVPKFPNITDVVICNLSYDDYLPTTMIEDEEWKKLRKIFQKAIEVYIQKIFQPTSEQLVETSEQLVRFLKKLEKAFPTNTETIKHFTLILDDNFYYSSMRHEWYQVARKYELGFGQVFLKCDLSLALTRNAQRTDSERVPEEVVRRMNDRAEWPNPKYDKKYCHTIILENDELIETNLLSVINLIITTLNDPVQPLDDNNDEKELSKIEVTKNLIHQSDIILRKCVSQVMQEKGKNIKKDLAAKIINIRHNILSKIQDNELTFSDLTGEELNLSILSEKLEKIFWSELNLITPGSSA